MAGLATILILLSMLGFLVLLVMLIINAIKRNPVKPYAIGLGVAFVVFILGCIIMPTSDNVESTKSTEEENTPVVVEQEESVPVVEKEETISPTEFEVTVDVVGAWNGNKLSFDIDTNLPDETELMLSLRSGDYNTDVNFTAQDKVVVKDGKAKCEGFSNKGDKLSGAFDLTVSMSLPKLQSEKVQSVVGTSGEYMTGPLVSKSDISDANTVSAIFTVDAGNDVTVEYSGDYQNTTFREDDEEDISEEEIQAIVDDYNSADAETDIVKAQIQKYIDENYTFTVMDKITVNPNAGTDETGDYIVLVNLTWNQKNKGATSKQMLDMYSSDMAARMYNDLPEVQELCVFWTVPYLNNGSAKISFERANGGMAYMDKVFDKNFD